MAGGDRYTCPHALHTPTGTLARTFNLEGSLEKQFLKVRNLYKNEKNLSLTNLSFRFYISMSGLCQLRQTCTFWLLQLYFSE